VLERNLSMEEMSKKLKKEQRSIEIQKIKSNYSLIIGGIILLVIILVTILGPYLIKFDPNEMRVTQRLMPPNSTNIFGTDEFGRELFTRIVYGARVSIFVGFSVSLVSSILGVIIGLYASYFRILDNVLMCISDGLMAIPGILLAIASMAALGNSVWNIIIALIIVYTPNVARIARASALQVKEQAYIEAIYTQGASSFRIMWGSIAPNIISPVIVQATFIFASAILSEAALSFLGAGISPADASWGSILQASKQVIYKAWWMVAFPGITIVLTVLSLNLLGDGLRDFFDPRIKDND